MISLICAASQNGVIGHNNKLPWQLPADLKRFKSLTLHHHVIMGRKTFQSIGRPLPDRTNIVVTRQKDFQAEGCLVAASLEHALSLCQQDDEIFIIGGATIYEQAVALADRLYLTIIHHDFEGDTFLFKRDGAVWQESSREDFEPDERNRFHYTFFTLEKKKEGHLRRIEPSET